jgi:RNA polymerase sigma-70 factor (ECF subfamily)
VTRTPAPELTRWIAEAQAGDRAALERVLAEVAPTVHRFALRMCGDVDDADDVLQDTLLQVVLHLHAFEGRSSLPTWIFTLARTACSRRTRGKKNAPHDDESHTVHVASTAESPERTAERRELLDVVTEGLASLPEEPREVLLLRDVEGLSAANTAAVLHVSVDAVKSRLHRARTLLRERVRPTLEPDATPRSGCPDIVALWSQKLEDDLQPADCAAMEDHMRTCTNCSAACTALKLSVAACRRVAQDDDDTVPAVLQARIKRAIRIVVQSSDVAH